MTSAMTVEAYMVSTFLQKKLQGFQTPGQYAPQADGEGAGRRQHGPGGNAQ